VVDIRAEPSVKAAVRHRSTITM